MTTISSNSMTTTHLSPRAMMDKRIDAAVQAGSISATDETAMETALDAIDSAIGTGGSAGGTSRLDPSKMKERIDSLIQQQVDGGTLTSDQASALQSLFAQGGQGQAQGDGSDGGVEGVSGTSGASGACRMGPPPPGGPGGAGGKSADSDSDDTSETDATKQLDTLISFLTNLRTQMASNDVYSANGSSATATTDSSSTAGLLVDTLA